jgi:peptidoglycan/xylan/chitin deacetylase (PgdA/CDA1 family)
LNVLLRAATSLAAPAGARGRLSVFYFHRVPERADPLLPFEPDAQTFDRLLGWISAQFRVLDPLEACERLYDGTLPARAAILSFDDGYADNCTVALPILKRHRVRAAFFVATGYLGGGTMFNDRVIEAVRRCADDHLTLDVMTGDGSHCSRAIERLPLRNHAERRVAIDRILGAIKHLEPELRLERVRALERQANAVESAKTTPMMLTAEQVSTMHREGMQIGGHTRSHPILVMLNDDEARSEIEGGLSDLAAIIGGRPRLFAYPNGRRVSDFDERHAHMVEACGVQFAFTTHPGAAGRRSSRYALPRFTPWDRTPLRFGMRALLNLRSGDAA